MSALAQEDMGEFQTNTIEKALGATDVPLLVPSSKKSARSRCWDNYSRASPKVARQAADDDASVSSAARMDMDGLTREAQRADLERDLAAQALEEAQAENARLRAKFGEA